MKASLDHIVLNVADVESSLSFYLDVIGLAPERVEEYRRGEVAFPSVRINEDSIIDLAAPALWTSDGQGSRVTNLNHFCLSIAASQWPALAQRLKRAGVEFETGPVTLLGARGEATAYYLHDPDGNLLELRYYA